MIKTLNVIRFFIWAANISILANTRPKMVIFYTNLAFVQKLCQKKSSPIVKQKRIIPNFTPSNSGASVIASAAKQSTDFRFASLRGRNDRSKPGKGLHNGKERIHIHIV